MKRRVSFPLGEELSITQAMDIRCMRPGKDRISKLMSKVIPPVIDPLPQDALPRSQSRRLRDKFPMTPAPAEYFQLSRAPLGESLFAYRTRKLEYFDTDDPYIRETPDPLEYSSMHDPALRKFWKERAECDQGIFTPNGGVLCSLSQFNTYRLYLSRLHAYQVIRELKRQECASDREAKVIRKIFHNLVLSKRREKEQVFEERRHLQSQMKLRQQKEVEWLKKKKHERNLERKQEIEEQKTAERKFKQCRREIDAARAALRVKEMRNLNKEMRKKTLIYLYCRGEYSERLRTAFAEHKKKLRHLNLKDFVSSKREFQERKIRYERAILFLRDSLRQKCGPVLVERAEKPSEESTEIAYDPGHTPNERVKDCKEKAKGATVVPKLKKHSIDEENESSEAEAEETSEGSSKIASDLVNTSIKRAKTINGDSKLIKSEENERSEAEGEDTPGGSSKIASDLVNTSIKRAKTINGDSKLIKSEENERSEAEGEDTPEGSSKIASDLGNTSIEKVKHGQKEAELTKRASKLLKYEKNETLEDEAEKTSEGSSKIASDLAKTSIERANDFNQEAELTNQPSVGKHSIDETNKSADELSRIASALVKKSIDRAKECKEKEEAEIINQGSKSGEYSIDNTNKSSDELSRIASALVNKSIERAKECKEAAEAELTNPASKLLEYSIDEANESSDELSKIASALVNKSIERAKECKEEAELANQASKLVKSSPEEANRSSDELSKIASALVNKSIENAKNCKEEADELTNTASRLVKNAIEEIDGNSDELSKIGSALVNSSIERAKECKEEAELANESSKLVKYSTDDDETNESSDELSKIASALANTSIERAKDCKEKADGTSLVSKLKKHSIEEANKNSEDETEEKSEELSKIAAALVNTSIENVKECKEEAELTCLVSQLVKYSIDETNANSEDEVSEIEFELEEAKLIPLASEAEMVNGSMDCANLDPDEEGISPIRSQIRMQLSSIREELEALKGQLAEKGIIKR